MKTQNNKQTIIKVRGIILHEGKLLVVRHPHDTSFAALPGGHLEHGESPKECVVREIKEELGVAGEVGRLLYINTYTQSDEKHYIELFFEILNGGDYLNTTELTRSHAHEIAEVVWVSRTDDIKIMPKGLDTDFKEGKLLSDSVRHLKG